MKKNLKVYIIKNGKHKKECKKSAKITEDLIKHFPLSEFYIMETEAPRHAVEIVREAADKGTDIIIVSGGDGTVFEAVNGILNSAKKPALGIIPCGSSNDFFKSLLEIYNYNPENLTEYLKRGKVKEIDTGMIEYYDENNNPQKSYFVNIAEIGLGAKTVQKTKNARQFFNSKITYIIKSISTMFSFDYPKIEIHYKTQEGEFMEKNKITEIVFANARYFGNGLKIAPHSVLDDGFLDMVIASTVSLFKFVVNLKNIRKGKTLEHLGVKYLKIKEAVIKNLSEKKYPIEAEGEFLGYLPIKIKILSKSLKIIC